ncbi:MAG TPA: hypothetical protein VLJ44_03335 [Gaiellaceae bacterium]|nr:hypothetical protein [Gaiellaceae bacterium]
MRNARLYAVLLYLASTSLAHSASSAGPILALGSLIAMVAVWRKRERKPKAARQRVSRTRSAPVRAPQPAEFVPVGFELADDRLDALEEARIGWRRSVVETRPANREQVDAALHEAYEIAGLPAPRICWVDSPAVLVRLTGNAELVQEPIRRVLEFPVIDELPAPCELDRYLRQAWLSATTTGRIMNRTFGFGRNWSTMGPIRTEIANRARRAPVTAESMIALVGKAEFISASSWLTLGPWRPLVTLAREAWGYFPCKDTAYVCERHAAISLDGDDRLHSEDGPAIEWADGFAVHAWHGLHVPRELFERRASITYEQIAAEENVARRELLIALYGYDGLLEKGPSILMDDDVSGRLWQVPIQGVEAVAFVEVLNATVETSGERRRFFLRVPPNMRTTREAVAWTFGLTETAWSIAAES